MAKKLINRLDRTASPGSKVSEQDLLNYSVGAFLTDEENRTLWVNGMPYGNAYISSSETRQPKHAEIFNDFDRNKAEGHYSHAEGGAYVNTVYNNAKITKLETPKTIGEVSYRYSVPYTSVLNKMIQVMANENMNIPLYVAINNENRLDPHSDIETSNDIITEYDTENTLKAITEDGISDSTTGSGAQLVNNKVTSSEPTKYYIKEFSTDNTNIYFNVATSFTSEAEELPEYCNGKTMYFHYYYAYDGKDGWTEATKDGAHAEGISQAHGVMSHAEGFANRSYEDYSHTEGVGNEVYGLAAHAEGDRNIVTNSAPYSHAEGHMNIAKADSVHVEGRNNLGNNTGAHVEGGRNKVDGLYGHAEGYGNTVNNEYGHAEGQNNTLNGIAGHAEGYGNKVNNDYGHAEGQNTVANGIGAHTEGIGTITTNNAEHAEGMYNVSENGYISSIGIGSDDSTRKNAITVLSDGRAYLTKTYDKQGNITKEYDPCDYDGSTVENATSLQKLLGETLVKLENISYANLRELKEQGGLTPGKFYKITDYVTDIDTDNTINNNVKSDCKQFDIIVLALNNETLSENAYIQAKSKLDIQNIPNNFYGIFDSEVDKVIDEAGKPVISTNIKYFDIFAINNDYNVTVYSIENTNGQNTYKNAGTLDLSNCQFSIKNDNPTSIEVVDKLHKDNIKYEFDTSNFRNVTNENVKTHLDKFNFCRFYRREGIEKKYVFIDCINVFNQQPTLITDKYYDNILKNYENIKLSSWNVKYTLNNSDFQNDKYIPKYLTYYSSDSDVIKNYLTYYIESEEFDMKNYVSTQYPFVGFTEEEIQNIQHRFNIVDPFDPDNSKYKDVLNYCILTNSSSITSKTDESFKAYLCKQDESKLINDSETIGDENYKLTNFTQSIVSFKGNEPAQEYIMYCYNDMHNEGILPIISVAQNRQYKAPTSTYILNEPTGSGWGQTASSTSTTAFYDTKLKNGNVTNFYLKHIRGEEQSSDTVIPYYSSTGSNPLSNGYTPTFIKGIGLDTTNNNTVVKLELTDADGSDITFILDENIDVNEFLDEHQNIKTGLENLRNERNFTSTNYKIYRNIYRYEDVDGTGTWLLVNNPTYEKISELQTDTSYTSTRYILAAQTGNTIESVNAYGDYVYYNAILYNDDIAIDPKNIAKSNFNFDYTKTQYSTTDIVYPNIILHSDDFVSSLYNYSTLGISINARKIKIDGIEYELSGKLQNTKNVSCGGRNIAYSKYSQINEIFYDESIYSCYYNTNETTFCYLSSLFGDVDIAFDPVKEIFSFFEENINLSTTTGVSYIFGSMIAGDKKRIYKKNINDGETIVELSQLPVYCYNFIKKLHEISHTNGYASELINIYNTYYFYKGNIYYVRDEHNNTANYDISNIMFNDGTKYCYTFYETTKVENEIRFKNSSAYNNSINTNGWPHCVFETTYNDETYSCQYTIANNVLSESNNVRSSRLNFINNRFSNVNNCIFENTVDDAAVKIYNNEFKDLDKIKVNNINLANSIFCNFTKKTFSDVNINGAYINNLLSYEYSTNANQSNVMPLFSVGNIRFVNDTDVAVKYLEKGTFSYEQVNKESFSMPMYKTYSDTSGAKRSKSVTNTYIVPNRDYALKLDNANNILYSKDGSAETRKGVRFENEKLDLGFLYGSGYAQFISYWGERKSSVTAGGLSDVTITYNFKYENGTTLSTNVVKIEKTIKTSSKRADVWSQDVKKDIYCLFGIKLGLDLSEEGFTFEETTKRIKDKDDNVVGFFNGSDNILYLDSVVISNFSWTISASHPKKPRIYDIYVYPLKHVNTSTKLSSAITKFNTGYTFSPSYTYHNVAANQSINLSIYKITSENVPYYIFDKTGLTVKTNIDTHCTFNQFGAEKLKDQN